MTEVNVNALLLLLFFSHLEKNWPCAFLFFLKLWPNFMEFCAKVL